MAQDQRKRQKALERRAAKASQRKVAQRRQQQHEREFQASARPLLRAAGSWPVHEVLLAESWTDTTQLTHALVARRSERGEIAVAVFLVDLGCLGVKSAFARLFRNRTDYESELRGAIMEMQPMASAELNDVARILSEAIRYARELGFPPNREYYDAELVLGAVEPNTALTVPLGLDGKPFYVPGPEDNVRAIEAALTRKLGPEGFVIGVRELDDEEEEGHVHGPHCAHGHHHHHEHEEEPEEAGASEAAGEGEGESTP